MVENKQIHLSFPKKALNKISLKDGDQIVARIENDKIILQPQPSKDSQNQSLRWYLLPAILAGVISLINFHLQRVKSVSLSGADSIAQLAIYLSTAFGFITFLAALIFLSPDQFPINNRWAKFRSVVTLSIAFTVLDFAFMSLLFYCIDLAFHGVILDRYTSSAIIAGFVGVSSYLMINAAQSITFSAMSTVLIFTLIGGIFLSMIMNNHANWWQINFSYLGSNLSNNWWQFNFTLIFSSLIMLTLIDYIFSLIFKIDTFKTVRMQTLRWLLVGTSISFGLVGVFQNNRSIEWLHQLHWWTSNLLVIFILIIIFGIKWLLPTATKEFLFTAAVFAGLLVLSEILFQWVHYLSLTAFEIISFGLSFAWLIILMQNLNNLYIEKSETFIIEIK